MDLRLQHLRCSVALADERSFTRAAKKVAITQPSLSEAIRELEAVLQIQLFTRSSRFVEVSQEGASLLPAARDANDAVDRFRAQAASLIAQSGQQPLRIGAPLYSACPSLELEIIERFGKRFPSQSALVVRRTVVDLLDLIKANGLDLTFVLGPCTDPDLSLLKIDFVPFTLVVPRTSPFARPGPVPITALAGLHIAGYERSGSPVIFDRLMGPLLAAGAILDPVPESSILGMRRHCEAHGSGMLVSQEWLAGLIADQTFVCLDIADMTLGLDLWLGRTRGPQSPGAQKFWQLARTDFAAQIEPLAPSS